MGHRLWEHIDLVMGGSPCFARGTKVITNTGYKNIEDIKVGDKVLTHTGFFKKVLRVGASAKDTVELKAQGILPTTTTTNHPYYVRKSSKVWDNSIRSSVRVFSEPYWSEVKDITKGDYIGLPINTMSENPHSITMDEAFVLGRYIADGHIRKDFRVSESRPNDRYWQVILSVGKNKLAEFKSATQLKYSCYLHSKGVYRCVFSSKRLVNLIEEYFGTGAENKVISQICLNLPTPLLQRVIEGYLSGDGSKRREEYRATTVSKELAMSLCLAVAKVYRVNANIEYTKRPGKHIIQGREVNQKDTYTVSFRKEMKKQSHPKIIGDIVWLPVKEVSTTNKVETVYNLEVAEDNSYTANNAIVHNCQGFSFAGKQLAFDDPRSRLFFVFADILTYARKCNPRVKFLLENVNMKKDYLRIISERVGVFPVNINSALVSTQNRNRWYWTDIKTRKEGLFDEDIYAAIPQPHDRGIMLRDILDADVDEKYYLNEESVKKLIINTDRHKEKHDFGVSFHEISRNGIDDLVCVRMIDRNPENPSDRRAGIYLEQRLEPKTDGKTNCLTSVSKDNLILQLPRGYNKGGLHAEKSPALSANAWEQNNLAVIGNIYDNGHNSQAGRVYGIDGKSTALRGEAGGVGSKTGLYMDGMRIRRLTPTECARLQTVPEWYKWNCSETQQYRMLGNGWTVEVIKHILSFGKWE